VKSVKLDEPTGDELPLRGFAVDDPGFQAPRQTEVAFPLMFHQHQNVYNY
jgi:hypothetical protein